MAEMSAADVRLKAQAALADSSIYDLRGLLVEQHNGNLVISGLVSQYYHKQLAQEIVLSICQDIEVINSIHVR